MDYNMHPRLVRCIPCAIDLETAATEPKCAQCGRVMITVTKYTGSTTPGSYGIAPKPAPKE